MVSVRNINKKDNPIDLQAVFFDLGDTLAVYKPSRELIFMQSAQEAGIKLSLSAVRRGYECVDFGMSYSSLLISEKKDREAFYGAYNEKLCQTLGISTHFKTIYPRVLQNFRHKGRWHLRPGVKKVLGLLRDKEIRLALVANWDESLADRAQRLGIALYFECMLSSAELGMEKPDRGIFHGAIRKMGLPKKSRILYVGNEYRADILGARSAGLIPCLLDPRNRYPFADCLRIKHLEDLSRILISGRTVNYPKKFSETIGRI
jgi:putative hydrolase of the HAD superfamily